MCGDWIKDDSNVSLVLCPAECSTWEHVSKPSGQVLLRRESSRTSSYMSAAEQENSGPPDPEYDPEHRPTERRPFQRLHLNVT